MTSPCTLLLTALAMVFFAGNSLLCRLALGRTAIDAASFTSLRLLAGAVMLALLLGWRDGRYRVGGSAPSGLCLFLYAALFSYAYLELSAGMGALLLFGAVQATMIGHGLCRGERLQPRQWLGFAVALAGLVALLAPGLSALPPGAAVSMLGAGVAWGAYSLRGKGAADPLALTVGNFLLAVPLAALLSLLTLTQATLDSPGVLYALISGALTSGVGYAVWYAALRELPATLAASVQLSVPVLAAAGGVLFLQEPLTLRLVGGALAVLGGIALVMLKRTIQDAR